MTSRLKRKLDNMGVDSSSVTESFCMIGTPLPPLEKADKNEFVPLWKQEVRDEQGRRRLHGAFTGGFSAGYFNTVGSKEGWTPSTFTSSRSARATVAKKGSRPEDYMDEEDLARIRESQQLVDTTESHDILGGTAAEKGGQSDDSLDGVLQSLVPDPRDSVGTKLLQRMGWRPGQGIGPRVSYRRLKLQDRKAGAVPDPDAGADEDMDHEEASKHMYAPRDTKAVVYRAKDNVFGLGFVPGRGLGEVPGTASKGASQGPQLSAGFGLGALNDAEDDDMDVYDGSHAIGDKRRVAYTGGDDEEDERILLDSRQASSFRGNGRSRAQAPPPTASLQRFNDGRPVLPGFKLASLPVVEGAWFAPPDVPSDWEPDPKRVWSQNGSIKTTGPSSSIMNAKGAHSISAEERGAILGEKPLVSRSVFDYLSSKDKERLKNLAASVKSGPGLGSTQAPFAPTVVPAEIKPEIPPIDAPIAAAALRGFQPFVTDPVKQSRYTVYLQSQAGKTESPPDLAPQRGQSVEEFNKEMEDYAKAAQIFKPVSGAMASRFTTASIAEMGPAPKQGLHQPTEEEAYVSTPPQEEVKVQESAKTHAARTGMYGPLTRETVPWSPAKLLCKRFGVRDPHPEGLAPDTKDSTAQWSAPQNSTSFEASQALPITAASSSFMEGKENVPSGKKDFSNVGLGEDDDQGRDILTYERPAMDIFKAIFASDDEESDDEEAAVPPQAATKGPEIKDEVTEPVAPDASSSRSSPPQSSKALEEITQVGPIDMSTFKPTFVSKAARGASAKDAGRGEERKEKKKKKEKNLLVSFDVEEGEESEASVPGPQKNAIKKRKREKDGHGTDRDRKEAKRKRKDEVKEIGAEEDEGMWVEKPPPDAVLRAGDPAPAPEVESASSYRMARKKAVDFL